MNISHSIATIRRVKVFAKSECKIKAIILWPEFLRVIDIIHECGFDDIRVKLTKQVYCLVDSKSKQDYHYYQRDDCSKGSFELIFSIVCEVDSLSEVVNRPKHIPYLSPQSLLTGFFLFLNDRFEFMVIIIIIWGFLLLQFDFIFCILLLHICMFMSGNGSQANKLSVLEYFKLLKDLKFTANINNNTSRNN